MQQARIWMIGLSVALLAACETPQTTQANQAAQARQAPQHPAPDADAVWQHMQEQNYRQWALWPGTERFYEGTDPHGARLTTYVNPIARQALEKGVPEDQMPRGSIIVKENYKPNKELAATTVMYKAEAGYNPEHNNWYWLKRTADGTVDASGKVEGCQSCHQAGKTDYLMTPIPKRG
jgi:hypothetical protein